MGRLRILFICLGNACRSPMAECIMNYLARENDLNWTCDSAALRSWNVGRKPTERCLQVLEENGMTLKHYGRMITMQDFQTFDYIIGMDEGNINELQIMANMAGSDCRAKIELLGTYLGEEYQEIIKDPFFSKGMNAFRITFSQIYESCQMFIKQHRTDNDNEMDEPFVQSF